MHDLNAAEQMPNPTAPYAASGAHNVIIWAPQGLSNPAPPLLSPIAYTASFLGQLYSTPATFPIR